jgi:hypothetical protein
MDSRKIASEYRLAHWASVMRDRQDSGQSIRAYCESIGLHENVYYYWQRKLREMACEQLIQMQPTNEATPNATNFAQVQIVEKTPTPEALPICYTGQLTIKAGAVEIIADNTYPAEKLAILIRELSQP